MKKEQKQELVRKIKENPKKMYSICQYYQITIIQAQKYIKKYGTISSPTKIR